MREPRRVGHLHVPKLGFRAKCSHPTSPPIPSTDPGLPTYLDPLDALRDNIGMVHGHQRDLDSGHLTHSACPHSWGESTSRSTLVACRGMGFATPVGKPIASLQTHMPRSGLSTQERLGRGGTGAESSHVATQKSAEMLPPPAQLTTQGVWREPYSVSTAATRRTPKSSVRTRMPVTGQFSMTWNREDLLLKPCGAL